MYSALFTGWPSAVDVHDACLQHPGAGEAGVRAQAFLFCSRRHLANPCHLMLMMLGPRLLLGLTFPAASVGVVNLLLCASVVEKLAFAC